MKREMNWGGGGGGVSELEKKLICCLGVGRGDGGRRVSGWPCEMVCESEMCIVNL